MANNEQMMDFGVNRWRECLQDSLRKQNKIIY